MAYKKVWVDGEVITAKELNRLEERIDESGGGSGGSEDLEELIPFHNMNGCIVCNGEKITLNVGTDVKVGQVISFEYKKSDGYKISARGSQMYDYIKQPVAMDGYAEDTFTVAEGYTTCKFTGAYFVIIPPSAGGGTSDFSGDYNDLTNKPIIPSKTSQLTNDSNFITSVPSEYVTETELNEKGYAKQTEVSEHNTSATSHNDIRLLIEGLTTRLNALANSDDTTLDQMAEVVAYIKNNKTLIDGITTSKINVTDIIDNLTTSASNKPLSAKQGVELKKLINAIVVPTKTSQLTNDSGFAKQTDVNALSEQIVDHKNNSTIHITSAERTKWNKNITDLESLTEEVADIPNNETLIENVADVVKVQVPLVQTVQQPNFANSVDEMTDTSKVYVMSDGYLYAYMQGESLGRTFTADEFQVCDVSSVGVIVESGTTRIAIKERVDLSEGALSIYCPEPYQYFLYYSSEDNSSSYLGKTAWKSGNIDDVLTDAVASGTLEGAKYVRISLRDKTNSSANLTGRVDEFLSNVVITQKSSAITTDWRSTGLSYNQPTDYEDRIVALEKTLEGIEYGSF